MNDETVLALGELSTNLLRNPHFDLLNKMFEQQVAADLLETKPSESEERERIYARLQGHRAFLMHIGLFASNYVKLTEKTPTNHDDDDDPSVHDF